LAQLDKILDENLSLTTTDNSTPDILLEPNIVDTPFPLFSVLSLSAPLSHTTPVVNEDLIFEAYILFHPESMFAAYSTFPLSTLDITEPIVFFSTPSTSVFPYNSVLDSGCTNHIFCDCSLFGTYNTSLAVPVKTANCSFLWTLAHSSIHFCITILHWLFLSNCGFLWTLACSSVCFCITLGSHSVVFVLKDCLHAPNVPINLLLIGALMEKNLDIFFVKDCTVLTFPTLHPALSGLLFKAVVLHRLSFLNCDFVLPLVAPSPSLPDPVSPLHNLSDCAFTMLFPWAPLTSKLWHCHLGHPGMEATHAVLTKDYATGIEHTGTFERSVRFW
jgi:hypothetical protein